jgi:hypothetical protein
LEDSGVGAMYKQKLRDVDDCILRNAAFLKMLVADADQMFENEVAEGANLGLFILLEE